MRKSLSELLAEKIEVLINVVNHLTQAKDLLDQLEKETKEEISFEREDEG